MIANTSDNLNQLVLHQDFNNTVPTGQLSTEKILNPDKPKKRPGTDTEKLAINAYQASREISTRSTPLPPLRPHSYPYRLGDLWGLVKFPEEGLFGSGVQEYYFSLEIAGDIIIQFSESIWAVDMMLLEYVDFIAEGGFYVAETLPNQRDRIERLSLPPGDYLLKVYHHDGVQLGDYNDNFAYSPVTDYQISFTADFAGNTRDNARSFGRLTSNSKTFSDYVGNLDEVDWYEFDLSNRGVVEIDMARTNASVQAGQNVIIQLYDESGNRIDLDRVRNSSGVTISKELGPGSYKIEVSGSSPSPSVAPFESAQFGYDISLSATGQSTRIPRPSGPLEPAGPFRPGQPFPFPAPPRTPLPDPPEPEIFDGAGNTMAEARDIGAIENNALRFSDYIGPQDVFDYYKFRITDASIFTAGLDISGADLSLFDSNGFIVVPLVQGQTAINGISYRLPIGTYYARVSANNNTGSNYQVVFNARTDTEPAGPPQDPPADPPQDQVDFAGNTFTTARNVGLVGLGPFSTYSDFVGDNDIDDYYRFRLGSNGQVAIRMSELTEDADLYLYDESQSLIAASELSEASNEFISENLLQGTYFVRVVSYAGANTSYRLSIQADNQGSVPVPRPNYPVSPDLGGNSFASARELGDIAASDAMIVDEIGGGDADDFYAFSLPAGSFYTTISLFGMSADADLYLYNANGNEIASSNVGGTEADDISIVLDGEGLYYARVVPFLDVITNYDLVISAIDLNSSIPDGAGDTQEAAKNIGVLSSNAKSYADYVGPADAYDIYRFTVNSGGLLDVNVAGLINDVRLQLFNGEAVLIAESFQQFDSSERISINVGPGVYYAQVLHSSPGDVIGTPYHIGFAVNS